MEPQTPAPEPTPQDQPVMAPTPMPEQQPIASATPMAQPMTSAPVTAGTVNPGHGLGIAGLVCAFLAPIVGLILSIIAMSKSKKAGMKNGLALAGIIISSINVVLGTLFLIGFIAGFGSIVQKCNDLGPGTHIEDGVTYTC